MFGNIVLSLVTGAAVGAGMYLLYGTARFKAQVGQNRLRSAVIVGVAVALLGFVLRYANLL